MAGRDVLSREFAQRRSKLISDVSYNIHLILKKSQKTYQGVCKIDFFLKKADTVKLDFIGTVKKVSVNGKEAAYTKDDYSINLKLNSGKNLVDVEYENNYDYTGSGLHHFVDPEDKQEYLYANSEPYSAHRIFPCFDQPDLKAAYTLKVSGPQDWLVIANSWGRERVEGELKTTEFERTKKFSTYLFHLSAGPYFAFEDKWKKMKIRIFCRQKIKQWVRAEEMFTITKQGLDFYSKYFDYPYPFDKYDQIFVPEFNHGAMENVGAVTFSEQLLYRHTPTKTEKTRVANVVLHEMVHMWFGDLVTMKWWGDLWLNESFADYLSFVCMVGATEFKNGWEDFYARKAWAYYQDQLITTHPIAADAEDTDVAYSNFDGISYSKGAAVLKQIMFYLGEDVFKKGVQKYFKKFQWGNAELKDFRQCLEEASKKDLKKWFKLWLETTGVNSIEPVYKTEKGKIKSFFVKQYPSRDNNLLRPHKVKACLFSEKGKVCRKVKELSFAYEKEQTELKELVGKPEPDFIFLNYQDQDYVKDILDKGSLEYVLNYVDRIKDSFTRQMVYGSLWQMVRDAQLDPIRYLKLVLEKAPKESVLLLLERLFGRVAAMLEFYTSEKDYYTYCEKFYKLGWDNIVKNISKQNKNAWFTLILAVSPGTKSMDKLVDLLESRIQIRNFEFNQDYRWSILTRLACTGYNRIDELLEKEVKRDPSDKGKKSSVKVQASKLQNKEKFWKTFISGEGYSLDYIRSGMEGFYYRRQRKDLSKFVDLYFANVISVFNSKDRYYSKEFITELFPHVFVDQQTVKKSREFIKNNSSAHSLLKKELLESIDELERAFRIVKKFSK